MAKPFYVRLTGAFGIILLAVGLVGVIPFLSADPSAGAGLLRTSTFSVNREFKSDRLPLVADLQLPANVQKTQPSQFPQEIPVGCDASFSPISAPRLSYIFGRCTT